jgi:predicted nucleic acid-binding protein
MILFLDSAALAKRYIAEEKSDILLCYPEVVSALCRRLREGNLSTESYELVKQALENDLTAAQVISISDDVLTLSSQLLERWPLRSADAIHVASALLAKADLFVSADKQQCTAATGVGLAVLNVGRRLSACGRPG